MYCNVLCNCVIKTRYSIFQSAVASIVDDVHLDPFVGRVSLHIRGTRRMGFGSQSNARSFGSRHYRAGVFPADFRSVPATSWLVEETDFQLDPLAGRKRRPYILQWVACPRRVSIFYF
jgi:hypothetical protein